MSVVPAPSAEVLWTPAGFASRRNAAIYCGCAEKTLAQYASQGTGPVFVKRGRCWYRKADLDAWLNKGGASSTSAVRLQAVA